MRATLLALVFLVGCQLDGPRRPEGVPEGAAWRLQAYADRHGITNEELDKHGDSWPQFIYDFSISHGPNLSEKEHEEYESWAGK